MLLLYNILDANEVIENEVFLFDPIGNEDEDVPRFWLKEYNYQITWYRDNPERGAFANIESSAQVALFILDEVRRAVYGENSKAV
jgi:hypothetical protein